MRTPGLAGWMGAFVAASALLQCGPTMAPAEDIVLVLPHGENILVDSSKGAEYVNKGSFTEQFVASGLTFNITYEDMNTGFDDPANGATLRRRFEDVLAYVAPVINFSNGTLDILVRTSETDGTGALATAGTFFPVNPGIHQGSTLDRLMNGTKPFGGFPEISVQVDLGFAWNVSTGAPARDEADFFSVLLHEVTHGLGFTSLIEPDGSSAVAPGVYSIFDSLLREGSSGLLLVRDGDPPVFQADTASLVGDDVWFFGRQAVAEYGQGTPVPIYAPNPYEPGSSTSHWDFSTLLGGGVMTHVITLGTSRRQYAPAELGALVDIGYVGIGGTPVAPTLGCHRPADTTESVRVQDLTFLGLVTAILLICSASHRVRSGRGLNPSNVSKLN